MENILGDKGLKVRRRQRLYVECNSNGKGNKNEASIDFGGPEILIAQVDLLYKRMYG